LRISSSLLAFPELIFQILMILQSIGILPTSKKLSPKKISGC